MRLFKVVPHSLSLRQEQAGLSEIQRASLRQGKKICARCLKFDSSGGGVCLLPLVAREDYLQSSVDTFGEGMGEGR